MRKLMCIAAIMALAVPVVAGQPGSKEYEMRIMGVEQDEEFSIPDGAEAFTYNETLDATSSVWDRVFGGSVDLTCNSAVVDSGSDGQYYDVIPIEVTAAENLEVEVVSFTGGDTTITLYCDPFDPMNPLANAVAYDDDDGIGTLSAFTAADGITLQPGNTYFFVLSTFSGGVTGDFQIDFTSPTVFVVPVDLQTFTIE